MVATVGGALIAATAVDRARPEDDSTMIQIHPDAYAAGGIMVAFGGLGTILDLAIPSPGPHD